MITFSEGYLCVNHYLFTVENTFNIEFEKIMYTQLVVVIVSGFLALLGIRILISSFDDDNDGDGIGMAYSTWDSYQFLILEGS